jgi:hypothetical protein
MSLTSGRPAEVALASTTQPGAVLHDSALTVHATADSIDLSQNLDSVHEAVLRLLRDSWLSQVRAYQPLSPDLSRS